MIKANIRQRLKWATSAFKNGIIQPNYGTTQTVFAYHQCEAIPIKLAAQMFVRNGEFIPETIIRRDLAYELAKKIVETYPITHEPDWGNGQTVYKMEIQVIKPKTEERCGNE